MILVDLPEVLADTRRQCPDGFPAIAWWASATASPRFCCRRCSPFADAAAFAPGLVYASLAEPGTGRGRTRAAHRD